MNETTSAERLPPETVAALLHSASRAKQQGDLASARAILHALAAHQPDEPRVWLALATVAETRAEQRRALEHVVALDPNHPLAQRGLERFQASAEAAPTLPHESLSGETPPAEAPTPEPAPTAEPRGEQRRVRWPAFVVLGVGALLVLALLVLLWPRSQNVTVSPTPRPSEAQTASANVGTSSTAEANADADAERIADATISASDSGISAATVVVNAASVVAATEAAQPTEAPPLATAPALEVGALLTAGTWHATLLRPEYAVALDGSIGTAQPQGRFVLALVVVGNDGAAPERIPTSLFTLEDTQGNRYTPEPAVSTTYLNTYGRGQRGDLSQEDAIPAGGGNVSVPLVFDVPTTVRTLTLRVGDSVGGWPVTFP